MNLQGTGWVGLQRTMEEHFNPGRPVEILLGLPVDLSSTQLDLLNAELRSQGVPLLSPAQIGSGPWPITLRLAVRRPQRSRGTGLLPLAVLIIGALGAVGVTGLLGWRLGEVISSMGEALSRSLIPMTLILGGVWVLTKYMERA